MLDALGPHDRAWVTWYVGLLLGAWLSSFFGTWQWGTLLGVGFWYPDVQGATLLSAIVVLLSACRWLLRWVRVEIDRRVR